MRKCLWCSCWLLVFLAGLTVGVAWGKGVKVPSSLYEGKSAKEAGAALLTTAEGQAGSGSWELIGVGRVYYLSGDKLKGQQLFDRVLSAKPAKDDRQRIARVYAEAGEWTKAGPLFKSVADEDPSDDSALAEAGALYNLNGDRTTAETLFKKSFDKKPGDFWNTVNAAGSYLGVKPN